MNFTTLIGRMSCTDWSGRPILLALIGVFTCLGGQLGSAQAASLDIAAAVSSASMANRGDSWEATWSAATAANDGSGVRADVVQHENGRHDSDGRRRVIRPFLVFHISGIPAGAQVTGASLILSVSSLLLPSDGDDEQTYIRVVPATPQDPNALTASDFGSVAFETLYSDKHFLHDMTVGTDFIIPLDQSIFAEITNGSTLTLTLINGHELENADHFPTWNVHNHDFSTDAPSSGTPPLLQITYEGVQVAIDIKPGSDPNSYGCKAVKGIVPVAVLSDVGFNATTADADSVRFGKTGTEAAEVHTNQDGSAKRHIGDVNKDGLLDMVFHFRFGDTGFSCADIPPGFKEASHAAILKGTANGTSIQGQDSLRLVTGQ